MTIQPKTLDNRNRLERFEAYMTLPEYEQHARAAWYSLIDAEQRRETAFRKHLTARVDYHLAERVAELEHSVPGLSTSAACRLLIVLGLENLEAIRHYAPEVLADAVRDTSTPLENSSRLAASVCPLTAAAIEELAVTVDERGI